MSNRIDYFQPEETSLAIPAAAYAVYVDGIFYNSLVPKEIIRGQWPDFSRASLILNSSEHSENVHELFAMGKPLSIRAFYNSGDTSDSKILSYSIFEGQIENSELELKSDNHRIEIVARDFSAAMERITVFGQRMIKDTGTVFLPGFETI